MAEEYNNNNNNNRVKQWWDSSTTTTSSSFDNPSLQMMGLGLTSNPIHDHNLMTGSGIFRPMYSDEPSSVKGFSLDQFSHTSSVDSCSHGGLTPIESAFMEPPLQSGFGYGSSDGLMGSPNCNWTPLGTTSSNKIQHDVPQFLKGSNQQHFVNNVNSHGGEFWNTAVHNMGEPRPVSFFPVVPPLVMPVFHDKHHQKNDTVAVKNMGTGVGRKSTSGSDRTSTTTTTSTGGGSAKRSRNEASSTMPPFKVRKEKMGDRITALQQLVSPFGKTDTASVLSEAIEYIKFLHEQVNVLSTPYLKSGASLQQQHQSRHEMVKDSEAPRKDLRTRGLCLVPISSTFPVAHETTVDFWTPTFGSTTFR